MNSNALRCRSHGSRWLWIGVLVVALSALAGGVRPEGVSRLRLLAAATAQQPPETAASLPAPARLSDADAQAGAAVRLGRMRQRQAARQASNIAAQRSGSLGPARLLPQPPLDPPEPPRTSDVAQ